MQKRNNQKKGLFLLIGVSLVLSACNSGSGSGSGSTSSGAASSNSLAASTGSSSNTSANLSGSNNTSPSTLPVIKGQNNQHLFTIPVSNQGNQSLKFATNQAPIRIRLNGLTLDQAKKAAAIANTGSNTSTATSDTYLPTATVTDINQFYGPQEVLNQGQFGTCVSFSTSAMIGYLSAGQTNAVSVLDILLQGYIDANNQINNSGWDGLDSASQVLARVVDNQEGYYSDYDSTINAYTTLSNEYANENNSSDDLTNTQLTGLAGFNTDLNQYLTLSANNSPTQANVAYSDLGLVQGQTSNATKVISALDSGKKVLIGFVVYDPTQPANCSNGATTGDSYYQYTNGVLAQSQVNNGTNSWTQAKGCVLGGHEVAVISYFKDKTGNVMFLIRNSWGDSGDQGNYYMSANYLNAAADDGTAIWANS